MDMVVKNAHYNIHVSTREYLHVCNTKGGDLGTMTGFVLFMLLSLTFNSGCSFTVVQYSQFSKRRARTHLPEQLATLDDLQQALFGEEKKIFS